MLWLYPGSGVAWGSLNTPRLPYERKELLAHFDSRMAEFRGDLTKLEHAIGTFVVGRQFGWKILLLAHDRKTIANYEKTLDLDFKEELPEVGPLARKSVGWAAVQKVASFWKAVKGEYPDVKSAILK